MADWIWFTVLLLAAAGAGALGYAWGRRDERDHQAEQRRLRKAARAALMAAVPTRPPPLAAPSSAQVAAGTLAAAAAASAGAAAAVAAPSAGQRLGREIADHVPSLRRSRELALADTAILEPRPSPAPSFADTQVQEP